METPRYPREEREIARLRRVHRGVREAVWEVTEAQSANREQVRRLTHTRGAIHEGLQAAWDALDRVDDLVRDRLVQLVPCLVCGGTGRDDVKTQLAHEEAVRTGAETVENYRCEACGGQGYEGGDRG
jgi:hypothetical protein